MINGIFHEFKTMRSIWRSPSDYGIPQREHINNADSQWDRTIYSINDFI